MSIKDYKWNVAFKSLSLAFMLYFIVLFIYSAVELSNKNMKFNQATEFLEKHKQLLIYTSLFVNTVFHTNDEVLKEIQTMQKKDGLKTYVYPGVGGDATYSGNDEIIISSIKYAFGNINPLIESDSASIYYRSYQNEGKIISFDDLGDIEIDESIFNEERCHKYNLCTIYASDESLSDRLLVSTVYNDYFTNLRTITLSSPIINDGDIVGDISADVFFDLSNLSDEASIYSKYLGGMNYIRVNYPGYIMGGLSFRKIYVIDNRTILEFEYPVSKLIIDTLLVFVVLIILSFILTRHYVQYSINKKKFHQIYEESSRDEMTGLYNRKVFSTPEFLSDTLNNTVAILAIDGNKLKHINDVYGHHYGDAAIKHISDTMKMVFRDSDYLVRTGGDEFIAILPSCPPPRVIELKEKLRKEVQSKKVRPYDLNVSISIGVAFKRPIDDMESSIIAADENLYKDKVEYEDIKNG